MDGLEYLSRASVESAIRRALGHHEATAEQAVAFRAWAWTVASVADTYATENPAACTELLAAEVAALHRVITERLLRVSGISTELVSKREFLASLLAQVNRHVIAPRLAS